MAFDFPASPTTGTVSNGYTWDGAMWVGGPGISGPQTEQFFDLTGKTQLDIQVPSWAKGAELKGCTAVASGASTFGVQISLDGMTFKAGATDYRYAGPHNLAQNAGTAYQTQAEATSAQMYLMFGADTFFIPNSFEATMNLVATAPNGVINSRAWATNMSSTGGLRTGWIHSYYVTNGVGAVKALRFIIAAAVAGSWVRIRWLGDSAAIPVSNAIADCPSDGGEYVRVNGLWRLKAQTLIGDGLATVDVAVPPGAKILKMNGVAYQPTTAVSSVLLRASLDGTTFLAGAADYTQSGYVNYSGNAPTTVQQSAGSFTNAYLTFNSTNVTVAHQFQAALVLTRPFTANGRWDLSVIGMCYGASAWCSGNTHTQVMETNAGSNLAIKAVRFFMGGSANFAAGSTIACEWVY
jgi:hypothetical protein